MTDPRRLAYAIDTVSGELYRWSGIAQQAAAGARQLQHREGEATRQTGRAAAIQLHYAQENLARSSDARRSMQEVVSRVRESRNAVRRTRNMIEQSLDTAKRTHAMWSTELHAAVDWQQRARTRLEEAIAWVGRAEAALRSAGNELSSAEDAFRRCQNDDDRRNCNREARRLATAEEAVEEARFELAAAQEERMLAQAEYEAATRRVACCEQAAAISADAIAAGLEAEGLIADAQHNVDLARAHSSSASDAVERAESESSLQFSAAEAMGRQARTAADVTQTASARLAVADRSYEDGHRNVMEARRDLGERVARLREFDTADL